MSVYRKLMQLGTRFFSSDKLLKWGFNLSPMYRRSTSRIQYVAIDLLKIKIRLPINYRNRNYMGTIFGGSMFSAVDPVPMVQLINLLGNEYVIWDKSATVRFKRPANVDLFAEFEYTKEELADIIEQVKNKNEIEIVKATYLTNKDKSIVYCEVHKTVYIADKAFFKQKRAKGNSNISVK